MGSFERNLNINNYRALFPAGMIIETSNMIFDDIQFKNLNMRAFRPSIYIGK